MTLKLEEILNFWSCMINFDGMMGLLSRDLYFCVMTKNVFFSFTANLCFSASAKIRTGLFWAAKIMDCLHQLLNILFELYLYFWEKNEKECDGLKPCSKPAPL